MRGTHVRSTRLALACFAAACCVGLLGSRAGACVSHGPAERVYTVRPGDSVWRIAARIVGSEGDPRPVVDQLIGANAIHDAVIAPGERLRIPANVNMP